MIIPECVESIAYRSFWENHKLQKINMPENVKHIGKEAFYSSTLQAINLPSNLLDIGEYAFADCMSLNNIYFNGTKAQWNAISKGSDWNYNVPATVVTCTDGTVEI